jgi:hypothetical protein
VFIRPSFLSVRANERGTTIYKIQKGFQSIFGFTLPMFHGRGLFNYCSFYSPQLTPPSSSIFHDFAAASANQAHHHVPAIGLMPYRHPIVSVVGHPISVTQNDNPSEAQLVETQARYIDELMSIWEKYKVSLELLLLFFFFSQHRPTRLRLDYVRRTYRTSTRGTERES